MQLTSAMYAVSERLRMGALRGTPVIHKPAVFIFRKHVAEELLHGITWFYYRLRCSVTFLQPAKATLHLRRNIHAMGGFRTTSAHSVASPSRTLHCFLLLSAFIWKRSHGKSHSETLNNAMQPQFAKYPQSSIITFCPCRHTEVKIYQAFTTAVSFEPDSACVMMDGYVINSSEPR